MPSAPTLAALDRSLRGMPGTVSVWCGPAEPAGANEPVRAGTPLGIGAAAYRRLADIRHYAASTMKVAVLVTLFRSADAGRLDLDARVPVVNDFASALPGAPRFAMDSRYDQDGDVWDRLGRAATLRWLATRMIVSSSNLATNVVLAHVGTVAVGAALRAAGVTHTRIERGIADSAASNAGIDNEVTARDLAVLMGAIACGRVSATDPAAAADPRIASATACAEMVDILLAQRHREDLAAGLPPGTRVALKNGWVRGVRHAAGVVFPDDAPPYALAVCTSNMAADDSAACDLIARIATASWADRVAIGTSPPAGQPPATHSDLQ
jgi:beta-lactamase class A